MRNGGGMISFVLNGGREAAIRVAEATRLFALAESLGGVESLIEVPAAMTHLSTAQSPLAVDPGIGAAFGGRGELVTICWRISSRRLQLA